MHEPHSSGVRRITHFVRVEVIMNNSETASGTSKAQVKVRLFEVLCLSRQDCERSWAKLNDGTDDKLRRLY